METMHPEPDTHRACRSQPVDVTSLHPSPTNPRKTFAGERFDQMVESVRQHGVMSPLLLRVWPANQPIAATYAHGFPAYEIVAGERRYRAALAAGVDVVPGLVRDLDDRQVVELQMVENLQREDLVELEEAEGYHLMMRDYGYTADDLAARIGKSKAYIYGRLKLLDLCEKARDAVRSGEIPASIGLLIARIPAKALQMQALADVSQGEMSARTAAAHVRARYMLELKSAPFPRDDAQLLPKAGTCADCPKRTGNQVDLFSDVDNADVCTDPDCYRDKRTAHMRREQAKIEARGGKVISGKEAEELMPYSSDHIAGGFAKLSEKCYDMRTDDGDVPTYAQLAKRAGIEPVVVVNETKGVMVKAVNMADLKKALKAAGEAAPESHDDKAKTEEKKRKAEQAFRLQLYTHIRAAVTQTAMRDPHAVLDSAHLRLIARRIYDGAGFDAQAKFAEFWVSKAEVSEAHARTRAVADRITSMTDAQLVLLMLDCCVGGSIAVPSYSNDYTTPAHLTELAVRWGIDAAALRKDMAAEARAKAKGTKAGTAKKTAPAPVKAARAAKSSAPETEADPAAFALGDRVRIVLPECNACGDEAEVLTLPSTFGSSLKVIVRGGARDGKGYLLLASDLEKLPAAEPAAPAGDTTPAPKPAARARKPKAPKQAADAASENDSPMESGRASPAGGDENDTTAPDAGDEAPVDRCDKTVDIFSGKAAIEEGAAA
jgi:ParB/RepB/Spo0J family partition protein